MSTGLTRGHALKPGLHDSPRPSFLLVEVIAPIRDLAGGSSCTQTAPWLELA